MEAKDRGEDVQYAAGPACEGENDEGEQKELLGNQLLLNNERAESIPQYFPHRRWSKFLLSFDLKPNDEISKNIAKTFCRLNPNNSINDITFKFKEIHFDRKKKTKSIETHVLSKINCNYDL